MKYASPNILALSSRTKEEIYSNHAESGKPGERKNKTEPEAQARSLPEREEREGLEERQKTVSPLSMSSMPRKTEKGSQKETQGVSLSFFLESAQSRKAPKLLSSKRKVSGTAQKGLISQLSYAAPQSDAGEGAGTGRAQA